MRSKLRQAVICAVTLAALASEAVAALGYSVEPDGWPNAAHRNAAVAAIQSTVNRYNAYGDFGNYTIYVYYNAGIPTAQASYLGSIGFGGTYPNERVTMHEVGHYLGSGTCGAPWDGARGEALIDQFDGIEAALQGDAIHFWPYGLNYDSEGSEINKQRQVAMIYAIRADMGIGSTANPWSATVVQLTGSDAVGESGFNYAGTWSDGRFAHPGAAYSTGNYLLRTPATGNSYTFVGESLTVNNTNGANGGLLYKGTGTSGVTTFRNLILDGGYVRHASGASDLLNLGGKVTLTGAATIDAAQGDVTISANIGGSGSLAKAGSHTLTLSGGNSYAGNTIISGGTVRLAPPVAVGSYSFDHVDGSKVVNDGTGGASMDGTLVNGAAIVSGGRFGNAVRLANGASVDINDPIADLGPAGNWTVSAWVKTATPGATILTKGDGTGWSYGNTIFYLGDGSGQGSGGIPSVVRWAGGFFQGSTVARAVNDNVWHQLAYVNNCGDYAIYVDGVAQPLSPGNSSLTVADIGTVVRLGVSTNTVAADGTVNFNGMLDSVQFFSQALSAAQVAALFQGQSAGPLPTTTKVSIASGGALDVNSMVQQIASLNGPVGSAVALGAGQLIINGSAGSSQFGGTISGIGGSLVKGGNSVLTLAGSNAYTGDTTVRGGTLAVNGAIAGALVVQEDGTVAPGTGLGSLSVGGSASIAGGLRVEYDTSSIDLLNVGGQLNVAAATVEFEGLGVLSSTGTYVFAQYSSLVGTRFANVINLPPTHAINYHYKGNSIALVPNVPADLDHDADVDGADCAMFQGCLTGPGLPYNPADLPSGCSLTPEENGHIAADLDDDRDVDQDDFGTLQRCYSGAGIEADMACGR